ncbi:MAG: hypothetical protein ACFNUM_07820 [Segatella salivae]
MFIPEVGDHVLVGFRHGAPTDPMSWEAYSTELRAREDLQRTI